MMIRIYPSRRVVCAATIELPLSSGAVWGQLRDFQSSSRHDPFHAVVRVEGDVPRAGAKLQLIHRHLLWTSVRVGRILLWNEGIGFAFSDLSQGDAGHAFPHVLSYSLQSLSDKLCVLRIMVRGRWTAPGPRWIGQIWLWWVFSYVARTVENKMLRFALSMRWRLDRNTK